MTAAIALHALAWMLVGHALADYPLQGDWLSRAKNPTLDLVPGEQIWVGAMACHAMIHAMAVGLATASWMLAALEFVAHALIDYGKCRGRYGYNADQLMHVNCKCVWVLLLVIMA